jgi:hypothetical protein
VRFKVKQRGHKEQNWKHQRLSQAVSFYAKTLRIPSPKELDITLKMSFNKKLVEEGQRGNCSPTIEDDSPLFERLWPTIEDGSTLFEGLWKTNPTEFVITLQGDMPWTWTLTTFAHEMVHAHQLATSRLRISLIDGEWMYSWMGGTYVKPKKGGSLDYREQPWETEAYAKEKALCDAFFKVEEATGLGY